MHSRRLVKRSLLGSRVCAGDGALLPGVVHAVKHENRDAPMGPRQSLCAALKQEGSLREYFEGDAAVCQEHTPAAGPLRSSLKVCDRFTVVCVCFVFSVMSHPAYCSVDGSSARTPCAAVYFYTNS